MEKEVSYIDINIYIECGENFKPKSKKNSILVHGYFGEYTWFQIIFNPGEIV